MTIVIGVANILVLLAISFLLWKRVSSPLRIFYWPALTFKLLGGIALGLLYTYYYTVGDTFAYFNDSSELAALARENFSAYVRFLWEGDESFPVWNKLFYQQTRSLFFVKITSVINLLTLGNYWIASLYFSFLSFLGAWSLVAVLVRLHQKLLFAAAFAFLFFPSIVFWSSGIIKESLSMGCLFFIVVVFLRLWMKEKINVRAWIMTALSLWILWSLKYYYLAVLMPVLCTALVMRLIVLPFFRFKKTWINLLVWCVVFTVPLYVVSLVHPNFYPERFLEVILNNYLDFTAISRPGSSIHYDSLQATFGSLLYHAPKALISGLFRPFITEAHTAFQFGIALENFVLVILAVTSIAHLKKSFDSENRLLVLSASVYIVILCIFLALSTPNFGTLARYRVGFLPFFVLLITADNPFVQRVLHFIQRSFGKLVQEGR